MSKTIRRNFLFLFLFLILVPALQALDSSEIVQEYRLRFYHTHTGERLDIVYRRGNSYMPEALATLDDFLSDHRTGTVRLSRSVCLLGRGRGQVSVAWM